MDSKVWRFLILDAGNASPEGCSFQNEPRGNKHNMLNITTLEGYVM